MSEDELEGHAAAGPFSVLEDVTLQEERITGYELWLIWQGRDRVPMMTEAELEKHVRDLIEKFHLLGYHTFDSRRSGAGYPDWTIVGPAGVIWRELKGSTTRTSRAQLQWLAALSKAGADAKTWRPADWVDGTIARELRAIARGSESLPLRRLGQRRT